jgi:hypothetical protein
MENFLKNVYLRLYKWVEKNKTEKQKLFKKIVAEYGLYSNFINLIVLDLLQKGINEDKIVQIHYITDYKEPLVSIQIYTGTNQILTYTV